MINTEECSIEFISVVPEYGGTAIDTRLMDKNPLGVCFREIRRFELMVAVDNEAARKLGFNTQKHIVAFRRT